jgi:UDP-GlcNAc:undecaprenyl-phosphate GlcNAc-1-phosphate transferase
MLTLVLTALVPLGCAAFALAMIVTPLARRLALATGLVDRPGGRKIHHSAKPYGGGIAIFLAVTLLTVGGYLAATLVDWQGVGLPGARALASYPALARGETIRRFLALAGAGAIVFVLGLVDDARTVGPRTKLLVQAAAATLLVLGGVRMTLFLAHPLPGALLSILWVVLVTNAFNLLDNMDGLSAGVAAVAALLFLVVALQGGQVFVAAYLAVFAGALLGFLWYNFPPSRLFMGDAGSLYVGFTLAALTLAGTYYEARGSFYAVATPVLVLGVPLFDTLSVLWIRWRRGAPLFLGDTNHISHRFVRLGMTRREAVLTIYLLGLILGGAATLLRQIDVAGAITVFLIGLGIIALIVLLETAAARNRSRAESRRGDTGRNGAGGPPDG